MFEQKPLPPGIHVIFNRSAAGIFNRVFRGGWNELLVAGDALCAGPTPAREKLEDWLQMRFEYWSGQVEDPEMLMPSPFGIEHNADRLREAERVTTWAGTSLSEQLFIAQVVQLADSAGVDPARLHLVQYEKGTLGDQPVVTTGELNEANMAAHPGIRQLSADDLESYRGLWQTLTADDPHAFENYASRYPRSNRWAQRAAQLMLRRFPDHNGLQYWDRAVLQRARARPPTVLRAIGDIIGNDWTHGDLVSEYYLFGRIRRLGDQRLPKPLLQLTGDYRDMRSTSMELTPFGREVAEGRASNYPANPIEDWVGGVKLSSASGRLWFNDGGKIVKAS